MQVAQAEPAHGGLLTASLAVQVFMVFAVASVIRLRAGRVLESPGFEHWARRFDAPLTETTVPMLKDRLGMALRWRHLGGTIGLALAAAPSMLQSIRPSLRLPTFGPVMPIGGYLLGKVVAEGFRLRRGLSGPHRASLSTRRVTDYVPGWALALLGALTAAAVVLAPIGYGNASGAGRTAIAVGTTLALGATVAAAAVLHKIARRPQPIGDADVVAADDALRSHGAHLLVGLAILATGFTAAGSADDIWLEWHGIAKTVATWLAIVGTVGVLLVGQWVITSSPWSVLRRRHAVTA